MQSQIDPQLPEETSGPNIGKILVWRLRAALGFARDESTAHGTAIEGLQEAVENLSEATNTSLTTIDNSIPGKVRSALLTGISFATNAAITATDTVLSALGKLQKQFTDHFIDAKGHMSAPQKENPAITGPAGTDNAGNLYGADGAVISTPSFSSSAKFMIDALKGGRSAAMTIIGDSTVAMNSLTLGDDNPLSGSAFEENNSPNTVFRTGIRLINLIAAKMPEVCVVGRSWFTSTIDYGGMSVLQNGISGMRYFNATGGYGLWQPAADMGDVGVGEVLDVQVYVALDNYSRGTIQTLAGRRSGIGARGWRFSVTATGELRGEIHRTVNDESPITVTSTALGLTNGQTAWLRMLFQPDNGSGQYRLRLQRITSGSNTPLSTWTTLADVVGSEGVVNVANPAGIDYELGTTGGNGNPAYGKFYLAEIRAGADQHATIHGYGKILNDYNIEAWTRSNNQPVSWGGSPTLYYFNGGEAGKNLDYQSELPRINNMIRRATNHLVMTCFGFNEAFSGGQLVTRLNTWITRFKAREPYADLIFLGQNNAQPGGSTSANKWFFANLVHSQILSWARANKIETIDMSRALVATGIEVQHVSPDGIHPLNTGYKLMANLLSRPFLNAIAAWVNPK